LRVLSQTVLQDAAEKELQNPDDVSTYLLAQVRFEVRILVSFYILCLS
jgi:hypothetical protein